MSAITYHRTETLIMLSPEAEEEMRAFDVLAVDPGFEGALFREQTAEMSECMKDQVTDRLMEMICPRMPEVLSA